MGVLNVATHRGGPPTDGTPGGGLSATESDATASKQVDIAEQFTRQLETFLSGFVPVDYHIKLNWGLLSPIFSVLSGIATSIGAVGVLA
jgi:hypothetical protein